MYEDPTLYYWKQEHISVSIANLDWNYANDDDQSASESAQQQLEDEYGLPVSDTSVGTGAAAPGWLIYIPGAVVSGAIWLFFQGEKIQPNIDA